MSWPLTRDMGEAAAYIARLDVAMAANPGAQRPVMAMMRHTAVHDRKADWMVPVRAVQRQLSQFENLFKNMGDVANGFPRAIPFDQLGNRAEYDPDMLRRQLVLPPRPSRPSFQLHHTPSPAPREVVVRVWLRSCPAAGFGRSA